MQEEKVWSVSEVNASVREVIEGCFVPMWVEGEIGNLSMQRSGHVYLTLKDQKSQIRAAYFGGAEIAGKLDLNVGSKVEAFGRLSVYEVRGEYQFLIKSMRVRGVGDLHRRFEEMKNRLAAEGLFDESRKKQIPLLPGKIGIVTSPDGAAIRDILQIISRRFPNLNIRIYPSPVQGKGAEKELAAGIRYFNEKSRVDVIIITRGGGSLEDLWPFNEEVLARQIAASGIPVISAVGHEIDFTICDFVSDMRVPTPSAAAELVVGKQEEFLGAIADFRRRLKGSFDIYLERLKNRFQKASQSHVFKEPLYMIRERQQRVDEISRRMENSLKFFTERMKSKSLELKSRLKNLNPEAVLERGYVIVTSSSDGRVVTSPDIPEGTLLDAKFAKGILQVKTLRKK
ncbi:MAG: exodeoxyribonuclease VII large subunit [Victivallales bacterium]